MSIPHTHVIAAFASRTQQETKTSTSLHDLAREAGFVPLTHRSMDACKVFMMKNKQSSLALRASDHAIQVLMPMACAAMCLFFAAIAVAIVLLFLVPFLSFAIPGVMIMACSIVITFAFVCAVLLCSVPIDGVRVFRTRWEARIVDVSVPNGLLPAPIQKDAEKLSEISQIPLRFTMHKFIVNGSIADPFLEVQQLGVVGEVCDSCILCQWGDDTYPESFYEEA